MLVHGYQLVMAYVRLRACIDKFCHKKYTYNNISRASGKAAVTLSFTDLPHQERCHRKGTGSNQRPY